MNRKLNEYKEYIKSKKVAVIGMGISNTPLIKYLLGLGVDITAFDRADADKLDNVIESFKGYNIKYSLGENYLLNLKGYDVIFKTPVVRYDIPELIKAKEEGAVVTSEMEVFVELCPAQIFAVTGSDGKTTTTTLIYMMLKEQGYNCWLGGNIGTPLLEKIDEVSKKDKVILELSSFQLHTMTKSPDIAVVTNITPNHLDVHNSYEEYIDAKMNIFKFQSSKDKLILNYDNDITKSFAPLANCKPVFFSRTNDIEEGSLLKDGVLIYRDRGMDTEYVHMNEIVIPGLHNVENYLASIAAVKDFVSPETVKKVATTFNGVEHRIELVRELNGVKYYNSSIDSSPNRTMAALQTFEQKVILIAGGKDKNIPYDEIGSALLEKVKLLILIGPTGPKIEEAMLKEVRRRGEDIDIPVIYCENYGEIVKTAFRKAESGDIVLLSPASTSFDMFRNFEERGNAFKELVNQLD